jgi:hypothetical protein
VFYDRQGHSEKVGFLEGRFADKFLIDLPGHTNQWNTVHKRVCDTGNQVGSTGATGGHTYTGFTGSTGIAMSHKTAPLFKTGQNGANLFALS